MPLSALPSTCSWGTTRGAVVDTTDRGAGLATNDKALVTAADILKLVSAVDMANADESTLSAVSSVLVDMNTTVTAQIAKKRSEVDKGGVDGEALTKKQKRLKKQLGEHVSPSDNASKTGLGVFHTPVGKRNVVPVLPDAPEKGVIRIGRVFQADVPPFRPMQTIDDRGDKLVTDPTGRDKLPKTHAVCGTPGCIFHDHHFGPHSTETSLSSRRICPPAKNINDYSSAAGDSADADSEDGVVKFRTAPRVILKSPDDTSKGRLVGSEPELVALDARRVGIIDMLKKKHGADFGGDNAGVDQVADHFKVMLLLAGYKDGGFCKTDNYFRRDGNAEKYPRYLKTFMNSKVFDARSDFFLEGAEEKALAFAKKYANECAARSPKYNSMSGARKAYFKRKQAHNIMHGFSDFVKLSASWISQ